MDRVVVVGAGIIGLFVANELIDQGFEVLLLEAADSPGGFSRSVVLGGYELDVGVRILPNTSFDLSRRFVAATGSIHHYVPLATRLHGDDDHSPLHLTDPAQWVDPSSDPAEAKDTGLYPRGGPFSRFTDAMAERVRSAPGCELRLRSAVDEFVYSGRRLRRVRSKGEWIESPEFVFSAAYPQLLKSLGTIAPPLAFKRLTQVSLLVRAPLPPYLWESNLVPGLVSRLSYPQRLRGIPASDLNLITCESIDTDQGTPFTKADIAIRVEGVIDQLVKMGRLDSSASVIESKGFEVRNAVPDPSANYFQDLGRTVAQVSAAAVNVHFTGVPAILATVAPANDALIAASSLAEQLARRAGLD